MIEYEQYLIRRDVRSHTELGEYGDSVYDTIRSAFGKPEFDRADANGHMTGDYVMVYPDPEDPSRAIAFSSLIFGSPQAVFQDSTLPDVQGCYFAGAAVHKDFQSRGVYTALNKHRVQVVLDRGDPLIFTRTQNGLVETSLTHTFERFQQDGKIQDFSLERRKLAGVYGAMLSSERPPRSPDPKIQMAYDALRPENGDAYILMYNPNINICGTHKCF